MTWLQILFYVIFNLPKLISLIGQIIDLIKGADPAMQVSLKEKLVDAIKHHKATGDQSKILEVCEGVGCAPQLKTE